MAAPRKRPSQNEDDAAPKETTYSDPGAIFSMYITRVKEFEDEKDLENWKGGADSILVFTGLFSSTVATFIALSYPNLQQDPNLTTQALLAQISQQLSNSTTTVGPSLQSSYVPPTSVVFINSVWFLSLVLSLTCALMATLLQQWARRYLQIVQRKYAPLHHARIHEFFSGGARRFGISKFVELLPLLLLLSIFLFFAGLVVFAFRSNHTVAYFTAAIVGFCALSYIAFTVMPLSFHDCPYHTPLTPVIRFSAQMISLSFFLVAYRYAKVARDRWGSVSEREILWIQDRLQYRTRSLSENIISRLENSAEPLSIDMYKNMLVRTVHWLNEDHELEEFVAGVPGLYGSEAFTHNGDAQSNVRTILAVLPGLTGSRESLPWNIIQLARRVPTSKLPKPEQRQRIRACLMALFYIPGAIRDVLAPYAVGKYYCLEILPLLNSPESLEIIKELWNSPNEDVALSVRCAAAVIAAFMITPPRRTLHCFVDPDVRFIWDDDAGKRFLARRLGVDGDTEDDLYSDDYLHSNDLHSNDLHSDDLHSDDARLQNIVRFLANIEDRLRYMNTPWWTSDNADQIRRERRVLFDTRHTHKYRNGSGMFIHQGSRASPAFVHAAQQDLITLTLEILARDPVAAVAAWRRDAFRNAFKYYVQAPLTQASTRAQAQALPQSMSEYETRARIRAQAADSLDMVKRALRPVLQSLLLEAHEIPPPEQIEAIPSLTVLSSAWGDTADLDQLPV